MPTLRRLFLTISILALAFVLPATVRAETTIAVSTTDDDISINGNCTLREAVIGANTNTAVDNCPAGSATDTIVLPAGTYFLALFGPGENAAHAGDLDILSDVTITGAGTNATVIDGASQEDPYADRVLHVLGNASLTLSGVTVRSGRCRGGAGILNLGRLVVQDSSVVGNIASDRFFSCWSSETGGGGIYNRGDATIRHSTIEGNAALGYSGYDDADTTGGGLLNTQVARIELSVLRGNWAAAGGAIFNQNVVQISDSWIDANGARFWGSALENNGLATAVRTTFSGNFESAIVNGGWNNRAARFILENSTVTDNQSYRLAGAIVNVAGELKVHASTVAGNDTQGIIGYAYTTTLLMNSIIAGNVERGCTGVMTSLGYNLDSDGTCGLNQHGDLPVTDPALAPLDDNGGPAPTRALLPGSPALDRIPATRCRVATDERGALRPAGSCDIGAFELAGTFAIRGS